MIAAVALWSSLASALGTPDGALLAAAETHAPAMVERDLRDDSRNVTLVHAGAPDDRMRAVSSNIDWTPLSWREAAAVAAVAAMLLVAILTIAARLVRRADRRRDEAQRALYAQRARASKLEALGTLAGAVAHDFNNVLAGIVGFGEMARDAAAPGSKQARHLDKVLQAALRGKAVVERILAFSRGGARAATVFELAPLVEEVLTLVSASLPPGVVMERAIDARGARVRGDATQAFEAVMNLCTNAIQAMPAGGLLGIQLRRARVDQPRVLSHSQLAAGDYLALTVTDQGGGITPAVMERLFEPFFTTRGAQSGTGLGLAVVFGVVAEFGGVIDVRSAPGQGASFCLYFPDCADAPGRLDTTAGIAPVSARPRLLVIDDEPDLVDLASEMLSGLGYDPVGYSDSTAALQSLRDNPQRYVAVITDEVMPQLSGTQMTRALRRFAPHLPVLLVTGYGGALLARRAAAAGVTRVLAKPVQRADLAHVLAEVLG